MISSSFTWLSLYANIPVDCGWAGLGWAGGQNMSQVASYLLGPGLCDYVNTGRWFAGNTPPLPLDTKVREVFTILGPYSG